MLTRDDLKAFCLSLPAAWEDFPFGIENAVYKVSKKMFALMPLDQPDETGIVVKCAPELVPLLRQTYSAVQPADYLNKQHWNYVVIDGSIRDEEILEWIDESYRLVVKGLTKKERERLGLMT
ncbi:MAG: MmcQ/YjbR family DNA-binding protein [Anaerolineae bacterium]